MKIYSFELGRKPVTWYYNEFKDMKFIGTASRRFKSNRNFLRIDNSIQKEDIKFTSGTYYSPAIDINVELYLKELNQEKQLFVLNPSNRGEHTKIAFLVIDSDCYRLLTILAYNSAYYNMDDVPENAGYNPPYIAKAVNSDDVKVAMIEFDDPKDENDIQVVSISVYNTQFKQYEYYIISNEEENGNLIMKSCEPSEEDREKIYQFDKSNKFKISCPIKTSIEVYNEISDEEV